MLLPDILPNKKTDLWYVLAKLEEERKAAALAAAANPVSPRANTSVSPRAPVGEVVKETGRQTREEELKKIEEERRAAASKVRRHFVLRSSY